LFEKQTGKFGAVKTKGYEFLSSTLMDFTEWEVMASWTILVFIGWAEGTADSTDTDVWFFVNSLFFHSYNKILLVNQFF
jgi:hypothetical protein